MHRNASSTLVVALALLVLLGVVLAAGCASTSPGTRVTPTPAAAGTTTTRTTAAAAVTTTGSSGSGAVAAVGYARLIPFIPKSAGAWTLDSDPMGMSGKDSNGQAYSWVTGTYSKSGDDTVQSNIQIHDLATAESPMKGFWKSFAAYDSTEGYMKSVSIKGFPAWDVYDKNTKIYSTMVGVGDRYLVYVTVEDGTKADLDTLVNAIDIAGLAAVK